MPCVSITAVSDIVLVCGSDRSIQVFDMNKGSVASTVPDAHSRAIHCITQNNVRLYLDTYGISQVQLKCCAVGGFGRWLGTLNLTQCKMLM